MLWRVPWRNDSVALEKVGQGVPGVGLYLVAQEPSPMAGAAEGV
jgi:hypothetical protein